MFGNLYGDENLPAGPNTSPVRMNGTSPPSNVPERRGPTNLCGLDNLGATCYLNSLIQTLFFTPEMRCQLLALEVDPTRVIPIELQKLFVQLLAYDVASVSTVKLTESFGWTDQEEIYQQQDVQELIKILFSAIQKSLAGTKGHDLISCLYQGETVSRVQCQRCDNVSVRDENFLDLTVAVGQKNNLKNSLYESYCSHELMSGSNQYLCPACQSLTDAKKVMKIRHLPPILTISLLRFLYDPVKQLRFKDNSRFEFPVELDMASFCEEELSSEQTVYELFSVVIHRGGAHGGHYHAIIQDIDHLGQWNITAKADMVKQDPGLPHPAGLVRDILHQAPDQTLSLQQLLDEILKRNGVSWAKSYMTKLGNIDNFLNSYCTNFYVEGKDLSNNVTMIEDLGPNVPDGKGEGSAASQAEMFAPLQRERHWFNLNDGDVTPVNEQDIENYFEGEESAYMLVYRRKSLMRPQEAIGSPLYNIPEHLKLWIKECNDEVNTTRENSHKIWLRILPRSSYTIFRKSLCPINGKTLELELTIDARESCATLRKQAMELCTSHLEKENIIGVTWPDLNCVLMVGYNSMEVGPPLQDMEAVSLEELKVESGQAFLAYNSAMEDVELLEETPAIDGWDENLECQPLQHVAVVDNISDTFDLTIVRLTDKFRVQVQVTATMTVRELMTTAEWEMSQLDSWETGQMMVYLGDDLGNLGTALDEQLSLQEAGITAGATVYIQPLDSQMWISYTVEEPNKVNINNSPRYLAVNSNDLIGSIVEDIAKSAKLENIENWHILHVNRSGEMVPVFRNPNAEFRKEKLSTGAHLVIRKGACPGKSLTRIKIQLCLPSLCQNVCPTKPPNLQVLGHIAIDSEAATLLDVKHKILALLEASHYGRCEVGQLRVRLISTKGGTRVGRILRDNNVNLRANDVNKASTLAVEVLLKEESLRGCECVLQVWRHQPGGVDYTGPTELVWDTSTSLAHAISCLLEVEQGNLVVAKFIPKPRHWDVFINPDDMVVEGEEWRNVLVLQDGDILGVKDASVETGSLKEFTTQSDLERWLRQQDQSDGERCLNEEAAAAALEWTTNPSQGRLPERGIHIHVNEFC